MYTFDVGTNLGTWIIFDRRPHRPLLVNYSYKQFFPNSNCSYRVGVQYY